MAASQSTASVSSSSKRLSSRAPSAELGPRSPRSGGRGDDLGSDLFLEGSEEALSAALVPVETLVSHLLAAKRALSNMTLVLRANDLATSARRLQEESAVLSAQAVFLRRGIEDQVAVLQDIGHVMDGALARSSKDFNNVVKGLDDANAALEGTLSMLRGTVVDIAFRPTGQDPRNLLDFIDADAVDKLRDTVKESLNAMKTTQTAFESDLVQFNDDLRALQNKFSPTPADEAPASSAAAHDMAFLLDSINMQSQQMAEHLASLTRHFDKCVTAVRATEGGAAMARRRAAEDSRTADDGSENAVSISGVIDDDDIEGSEQLLDADERRHVVQVVLQDAVEVESVVAELGEGLRTIDEDYTTLCEHAAVFRANHAAALDDFGALRAVGGKVSRYTVAQDEFVEQWETEHETVLARLGEMNELRAFYEGYAGAYDGLVMEAKRRRGVEDKISAIWRHAQEAADKLVETDRQERKNFMRDIGEFLPADIWAAGMVPSLPRWVAKPEDFTERQEATGDGEEEEQHSRIGGGGAGGGSGESDEEDVAAQTPGAGVGAGSLGGISKPGGSSRGGSG